MRVTTNTVSMTAQRSLGNVLDSQERAQNRLATGDRIFRAAFDPAGLAISEKMKAHIKSMGQAKRNTQEAISLFQVAEGALASIHSLSARMKELALQAANDTMGEAEKSFANIEFQKIKDEVRRVSAATNYNGRYLLDNSGQSYSMQVGIFHRDNERLEYDMSKIIRKANVFGAGGESINSKSGAQRALGVLDEMMNQVSASRASIGSMTNRMQSSISNNTVASENLSASRSKIRDVDYAAEAAENARASIVKDSNISALIASNNSGNAVLKLVG